jgi:tetratricopeptide (TPR) repeat protein
VHDVHRARFLCAQERYTAALEAAPRAASAAPQRAIYLCNRAACHLRLESAMPAVADCSAAIEADPRYTKAYLRRSAAYEALDDLEHALADMQKAKELDPGCAAAAAAVARLEPVVAERREKMKDEMMGKLKELGNTVLGKFGLSLDNFKAEKDPATGSYSIKFQ